jgi:hypothetical protein
MTYQLYMEQMSPERPEDWRDSAACLDADPEVFEIIDEDHILGKGLTISERIKLTSSFFEIAKYACSHCVVLDECWDAATLEDREWTYRAGRAPSKFSGKLPGRPKGFSPNDTSYIKEKRCSRGHVVPPDLARCPTCGKARKARWREKQKAAALAAKDV